MTAHDDRARDEQAAPSGDCVCCEASSRLCEGLVAQGSARCCTDCQHEQPDATAREISADGPDWVEALSNVPVQFWACEQHDRGRVEWRGDVAHCLEAGCGRTSEQPTPVGDDERRARPEVVERALKLQEGSVLAREVLRLRTGLDIVREALRLAEAEEARLRARDEAAKAVETAAERASVVIERVLDADASEGTPIWEWTDEEAETGVREVLAVADQLSKALDALSHAHEDEHGGTEPMSKFPEIWWSPSLAAKSPPGQAYAGFMWRYETGNGYTTPHDLPPDAVRVTAERVSAPVDWPARFRAAGEVAEREGDGWGSDVLDEAMHWALSAPPQVVEAVTRVLLGEVST